MKKKRTFLCYLCVVMIVSQMGMTIRMEAVADDTIYCPECGKQINASSKFCMYCGHAVPAISPGTNQSVGPEKQGSEYSSVLVGDTVFFGSYEQDNNYYNGKEDIEWYVIAKENSKVKLLSKYALDRQPYNEDWVEVVWENCTLREWLNSVFVNEAFSFSEKERIVLSQVNADKNPDYKTSPGHGTADWVFILSVNEFEGLSKSLKACSGTAYAYEQGVRESGNGNCTWWLRTPGWYSKSAVDVNNVGVANYDEHLYKGYNVNHRGHGVRPVIWVDLGW